MNGKSCLLCGKSLARIRVGSGGDFCSREHRNEYRLRRSLDCLTEADKVATLARRRETPKLVFAEPTPALATTAPRALEPVAEGQGLGTGASLVLPKIEGALWPKLKGSDGARRAAVSWPPAANPRPRIRQRAGAGAAGVAREFSFRPAPARSLRVPDCNPPEWKPRFSKEKSSHGAMAPPAVGNALRVSASVALRPGKLEIPRVLAAIALEKTGLRRDSRVRLLPPSPDGEATAARLGYIELAFTVASDAPARPEWIGKKPGRGPGQEFESDEQ
jgi:hypothetical protein